MKRTTDQTVWGSYCFLIILSSFKVASSHEKYRYSIDIYTAQAFLLTFSLPDQSREKVLIHYNWSIDRFLMETVIFTHFRCLIASTMIMKRHILCV